MKRAGMNIPNFFFFCLFVIFQAALHWINRKQNGKGKPLIDIHLAVVSRAALFWERKQTTESSCRVIKGNALRTGGVSPTTTQFFFSQTCVIIKSSRMFLFEPDESATGKNP